MALLAKVLETCQDFNDSQVYLLGILRSVADAIGFAHASQVIHRDLKPHNIMVGAFGEVQIMDWGMARLMDSGVMNSGVLDSGALEQEGNYEVESVLPASNAAATAKLNEQAALQTREGEIFGTPTFMSPEQARGDHLKVTFQSDVFALGAILFEVLTGTRLYQHVPSQQILAAAAGNDVQDSLLVLRKASVATELIQLCERCLALEPMDRPADGHEVARALSRYLESVDKRLRQAEIDRSAAEVLVREEKKRRRTFLTMACAVTAVTFLGLCGIAWQWSQANVNLREAKRQNQAREIYFSKSLEAIDRLLTRVGYETLKDVPGMGQLRRELLQDAQVFYQELIALSEQSSRVDLELAKVQRLSGETFLLLGDLPAARHSLEQALATLELLAQTATDSESTLRDDAGSATIEADASAEEIEFELVLSQLRLGDTLYQLSEQGLSAEELRDAIERIENSLARLDATNGRIDGGLELKDRWLLVLAEARSSYADVIFTMSNSDLANEQRKLARTAYEQVLAKGMPNEASLGYSRCLAALGEYERVNRRLDEAKTLEQQAVTIATEVVEQNPDSPSFRSALVKLLQVQNGNLAEDGYFEEAAAGLVQQMAQQERLIADFPNLPNLRSDLVRTYALYGSALDWLGRNDTALGILRDGLVLGEQLRQEFPESAQYIRELSFIRKKLGIAAANCQDKKIAASAVEHARQAYELDKMLVVMFPNNAGDQYEYALSAELLSRQMSLSDYSEEEEDHVLQQAVELMQEAVDTLERLVRDGSENSDHVSKLASLRVNFAYQLFFRSPEQAAEQLELSTAEFEELVRSLPDNPRFPMQLARTHDGMAMLLLSQDRVEECEQLLEEALQALQNAADHFGLNAHLTEFLSVGRNRLAHCKSRLGKHEEVGELYQAALEVREQYYAGDIGNDRLRVKVASAHGNLAWLAAVWLPAEESILQRGLEHAQKAVDCDPDSQKHLLVLGYLYLLLDEIEQASNLLTQVEPSQDHIGLARLAILTLQHVHQKEFDQALITLSAAEALSQERSLVEDLQSRLTFPEAQFLLVNAKQAFSETPATDSAQELTPEKPREIMAKPLVSSTAAPF